MTENPSRNPYEHPADTNEPMDGEPARVVTQNADGKEDKLEGLPNFMKNFTRGDWILWWVFAASGLYGLVLIPLRAVLLLDHTFLYTILTGSSLSVLKHGAQNPDRPGFLVSVVVIATLSMLKFLPIYYLIGKRMGAPFLEYQFMGKPPLWYRKLEGFIDSRIGLCLFLAYIPFSPVPAPILVIAAGVRRIPSRRIAAYVVTFAVMLKSFYLYLGLRFGEGVQETLVVIDRYMNWITIGLVAYLFLTLWIKQNRQAKRRGRSDA